MAEWTVHLYIQLYLKLSGFNGSIQQYTMFCFHKVLRSLVCNNCICESLHLRPKSLGTEPTNPKNSHWFCDLNMKENRIFSSSITTWGKTLDFLITIDFYITLYYPNLLKCYLRTDLFKILVANLLCSCRAFVSTIKEVRAQNWFAFLFFWRVIIF